MCQRIKLSFIVAYFLAKQYFKINCKIWNILQKVPAHVYQNRSDVFILTLWEMFCVFQMNQLGDARHSITCFSGIMLENSPQVLLTHCTEGFFVACICKLFCSCDVFIIALNFLARKNVMVL